jgi:L-ascorbate metabolism protein UlaG (beta-lactamase superfamily)
MDRLTYIGHATTLIRLGNTSILTDPMLRDWLGPLHRQGPRPDPGVPGDADLVLISHLHRDHLDVPSLRRLDSGTPVVAPRGAGGWVRGGGATEVHEIGVGESIAIGGVDVTAVRAEHDGYRDRHRGRQIQPLGYLVRGTERTVYFAGDTDLFPEMTELNTVDLALLPIWGWGLSVGQGHLDPARAATALEMIQPRLAIPIHWGTFYPAGLRLLRPGPLTEPALEFVRLARETAPEVEVRVLAPGDEAGLD